MNSVGREKNRQTITLMLPEMKFLQELAGRLEHFLYIAPAYALIRQVLLSLSEQVSQP